MNLTNFTKAEIIAGIQKARCWSFIDGAEQAVLIACIEQRMTGILSDQKALYQDDEKTLKELQTVSSQYDGCKHKDIPLDDLDRIIALHNKLNKNQRKDKKLDKQFEECRKALDAISGT